MGISADLIIFDGTGDDSLEDYGERISLYEFLPASLHQYITKTEVELYDIEFYRKKYKDPELTIRAMYGDGAIEFSNGAATGMPKTIKEETNTIKYRTLGYIGGSSEFVDEIFIYYDSRPAYPSFWPLSDMNKIVESKEKKAWIRKASTGFDKESIYITLNY